MMKQGSEWWNTWVAKILNTKEQKSLLLIVVQIIIANIYWVLVLNL